MKLGTKWARGVLWCWGLCGQVLVLLLVVVVVSVLLRVVLSFGFWFRFGVGFLVGIRFEVYLDVEGTDIQSAFVGSNPREILNRGRVSSVAHNNCIELEKILFKHKCFYLKPYELATLKPKRKSLRLPPPRGLNNYKQC